MAEQDQETQKNLEIVEGLTFDDLLLVPRYSDVLPSDIDVSTMLTQNIKLSIPIVSAPMDTVTTARTAIALAEEGGIGIIHKNMTVAEQVREVEKVKKYESGMIVNPITIRPTKKVKDAIRLMKEHNITGLPVVDDVDMVIGIVTYRDIRFEINHNKRIREVMTEKEYLVTAQEGIGREEAKQILNKEKIEKLPVVDEKGHLRGLITAKDIERTERFPRACKDDSGRLRCGAAIGVGKDKDERVSALIDVGCDVIVIDSAHGHSKGVIDTLKDIKRNFKIEVIAGNIATAEGAEALAKAGADAIKIGVGPGSICTTRIIAGVGVPQISAVMPAAIVARKYNIPAIADGGIKYSGDITKAIAAGADSVMIGNLFAGTDESPGELILFQGRTYKLYRGMGSMGAMKAGSADRYGQQDDMIDVTLIPQGVEGRIPYRGRLGNMIVQLVGGLRVGMGYQGTKTIAEMHKAKMQFNKITAAGLRESHVHDVFVIEEPENYRLP